MVRGTIISLAPIAMLPTFSYACSYSPVFLGVYAAYLASLGIALPFESHLGFYDRYWGDSSVPGRGEILLWRPSTAA